MIPFFFLNDYEFIWNQTNGTNVKRSVTWWRILWSDLPSLPEPEGTVRAESLGRVVFTTIQNPHHRQFTLSEVIVSFTSLLLCSDVVLMLVWFIFLCNALTDFLQGTEPTGWLCSLWAILCLYIVYSAIQYTTTTTHTEYDFHKKYTRKIIEFTGSVPD